MPVADTTLTYGTAFKRFDPLRFARRLRAAKAKHRNQGLFEAAPPRETVPRTSTSSSEWAVPPSMKRVVEIVPEHHNKDREVYSYRVVYNDGPCRRCWHCGYDLPQGEAPDVWGFFPVVIRMDRILRRFFTKGHYCTPSCALSGARLLQTSKSAVSLTRWFYSLRYGIDQREVIHPAPPRHCLQDYGGSMTIEEYRKAGWGGDPESALIRARDLPRPMTLAQEKPRADVVVWGPAGKPKPELWAARPATNGSSFARRQFWLARRETMEHPTAVGRPVWRNKNGRRNFMSHWSQKDADRKAASDAAAAQARRDLGMATAPAPAPHPTPAPKADTQSVRRFFS